jgi:lysophospholipase L1-like esterase
MSKSFSCWKQTMLASLEEIKERKEVPNVPHLSRRLQESYLRRFLYGRKRRSKGTYDMRHILHSICLPLLLVLMLILLVFVGAGISPVAAAGRSPTNLPPWFATWTASPQGPYAAGYTVNEPPLDNVFLNGQAWDQTVRLIVHTSAAGSRLRIRLSNLRGVQPLTFGSAYVGLRDVGAKIVRGTNHRVTFHGEPSVTIPPGQEQYSDPVDLKVDAQQDLAVSLFIPQESGLMTWHAAAFTTSYISNAFAGDFSTDLGDSGFPNKTTSWFWLDGIDVSTASVSGTVVTLADSITDGVLSDFDKNNRWPDVLARRFLQLPASQRKSVANEGISGNTVSAVVCAPCGPPGIERLDRDVLSQAGVRHVILFEGINDVGRGATANDIIAGMKTIIRRVHARGLKIFVGTLMPYEGFAFDHYYTPAKEKIRQTVNAWIRTSRIPDAVIDFDRLMRDPNHPTRLNPKYDSGDHIHPNAAGLRVMGNFINLSLFR